jgi:hypothetical protein
MQRLIRGLRLLALVGMLAASAAGCCCSCGKQGYVIHSDWTLTVNRQPCGGACATGDGCCTDQMVAGRAGRAGRAARESGPLVAGPGHFHPVPTRPVFGPRPDLVAVPVSAPLEDAPPALSDPEDVPVPDEDGKSAQQPTKRATVQQASTFATGCKSCR